MTKPATLKAIESGLEDIKNKVNYICSNRVSKKGRKGRGVQDDIWLEEASRVLNPDWEGSTYVEGISRRC